MLAPLVALYVMAVAWVNRTMDRAEEAHARYAQCQSGVINIGALLSIIVIIVVAVAGMGILASLAPQYMSSLADFVGVFNDVNSTTGDDTADTLLPTFGLLIAFAGLFALVGLGILVVKLRRGS